MPTDISKAGTPLTGTPKATDAAVLAVVDLRKEFALRGRGSRRMVAVDGVSLTLRRGGAIAVVGESGSGKTTLARMIVGLERPTSGVITFAEHHQQPGGQHHRRADETETGRGGRRRRLARARRAQMVFQDPYSSLDRHQSVGSALDEVRRLHFRQSPAERRERVHALAAQVGLDAALLDALPGALSGGQRQRVAIARALAAEPDVMVLDEAVAALDVSIQAQILNLLADLRERTDVGYLFISHDLAVVRQVTDEVIVMRGGQVVETGGTAAVLDDPKHEYTQRLRACVPAPGWDPSRLT